MLRNRGARTPKIVWKCQRNSTDGGPHSEARVDATGQSTRRIGGHGTTQRSSPKGARSAFDWLGLRHHSSNQRQAWIYAMNTGTNTRMQFWHYGVRTMCTRDPVNNFSMCCQPCSSSDRVGGTLHEDLCSDKVTQWWFKMFVLGSYCAWDPHKACFGGLKPKFWENIL